ncbi:MAG TPA: PAS domain S-box protein [Bryobacteraceae bacterium]|nr:PAS domain S-box protein [Bryobacteraceae bacterium]
MQRNRILIVEDERVVAEQLRQSLTSQGYDVVGVAQTGEDAIIEGGRSRPDLVIMDIMLPGAVDGISAAQQLEPLGVPVVFLTAYSDRHLIDRAKHTRPLGYIVKPAKSDELAAVVQLALFKRDEDRARDREDEKRLKVRQAANDQFRLMVAGVTDYAIFTLDPKGTINSWNAGAERIHGYSTNEVLGRPHEILFDPEDRKRNIPEKELQRAREHGTADDTRWLVRRDGARYWAEGVLTAVLDDDGVLTGFSKITRDATDRKKLQDVLTEQTIALRIALRAARTGTWHWDILSDTDTIDENLRELFGLASAQEIRTIEDFYAIVHPDDRERVKAAFEQTRQQGIHLDTEFRVPQRDGTERWLIDQGEVFTLDGKPAYMTGACVDVTERKKAEQALRMSEEQFRLFVNNVREYALIQQDTEGRITTWNSGAEAVLGYTASEIIGKPSSWLFVPEDVAAGEPQKEMREAVTLGRAIDERWHLRKDGSRFWCSGVLTVMRDDEGRLRGFAKVMRDETERRTTSEQLKASLAEKEVLLKEIHHRVKNNLQVITSLLALQSGTVEDRTVRDMFEDACNRVRSIGEIHELLYRSPDLARVDFGEYLEKLGNNLRDFYGEPERVRLNTASEVNLPLAQAIPCGLIVNELVTNSFKHAFPNGRSGRVDVFLKCERGKCVLQVSDDGVGVPSHVNFEEMNSLGLTLVSVLAKQLGGDLRVQGTAGTQVSVEFPEPIF